MLGLQGDTMTCAGIIAGLFAAWIICEYWYVIAGSIILLIAVAVGLFFHLALALVGVFSWYTEEVSKLLNAVWRGNDDGA